MYTAITVFVALMASLTTTLLAALLHWATGTTLNYGTLAAALFGTCFYLYDRKVRGRS